jgi:hypothetical protein
LYTRVVEMNLPAGKYLITGRGNAINQQALPDLVSCNVYTGAFTSVDANSTSVGSGEYAALAFSGIATLSTPGVVWVECIASAQSPGPFTVARLTATTAADVIRVP